MFSEILFYSNVILFHMGGLAVNLLSDCTCPCSHIERAGSTQNRAILEHLKSENQSTLAVVVLTTLKPIRCFLHWPVTFKLTFNVSNCFELEGHFAALRFLLKVCLGSWCEPAHRTTTEVQPNYRSSSTFARFRILKRYEAKTVKHDKSWPESVILMQFTF